MHKYVAMKSSLKHLLPALISILMCLPASARDKMPLRVLYVGGMTDIYEPAPEQRDSLIHARAEAFRDMLSSYFTSVTVLIGDQYTADMSDGYDVTILDGRPKELKPQVREYDESGNLKRYERATYLPADFDSPVITIGQIGEIVGRTIGSKNDWYCLCLDAQAHHWVKDHPIFKGPFKVKMTVENCPTPSDAYHYQYYHDGPIPDQIPMWRVQTKGYKTNDGFTIGMVSRPWGYADSPDAEYISSGVCAKTLDAVAIGRHGNFLHWGFAASPLYMTPEAKDVLANAVVYISGFKGKGMITRKFNDRIATREYLKELTFLSTKRSYDERMESDRKWTEENKARYQELINKKESGAELSPAEKKILSYGDPGEFKPMPRENYVKRYLKDFFGMFGTDEEAYSRYFRENHDYFYGGDGSYNIFVDEDVKAWGIPNNDHRLLDRAISELEKSTSGIEADRARRILTRYTMASFPSASEWRKWYDTYRDRFFFTESGGWKFMIDGQPDLPGNDYYLYNSRIAEQRTASTGTATSDESPVLATLNIENDIRGGRTLTLRIKIHPGYHIYADVAGDDPYVPTTLTLSLPEGLTAGEWTASRPGQFGTSGSTIYEDEAVYTCPVAGNTAGDVSCTVSYQCCDAHICLPPVKKTLRVSI